MYFFFAATDRAQVAWLKYWVVYALLVHELDGAWAWVLCRDHAALAALLWLQPPLFRGAARLHDAAARRLAALLAPAPIPAPRPASQADALFSSSDAAAAASNHTPALTPSGAAHLSFLSPSAADGLGSPPSSAADRDGGPGVRAAGSDGAAVKGGHGFVEDLDAEGDERGDAGGGGGGDHQKSD